jgi:hypothetical protein
LSWRPVAATGTGCALGPLFVTAKSWVESDLG